MVKEIDGRHDPKLHMLMPHGRRRLLPELLLLSVHYSCCIFHEPEGNVNVQAADPLSRFEAATFPNNDKQ